MYSSKPIIIIDFDETLYKKDSLIEFCKFVYRKHPFQILAIFPQVLGSLFYFLNLISTKFYKELFLLFLYGLDEGKVEQLAIDFWSNTNSENFNASIVSLLKNKSNIIICISASPELYLKPIMDTFNIECIGTILQYSKNRYTIVGENCKGIEKVNRLRKYLNIEDLEIEESYSDSDSDKPLFDCSKRAFKVTKLGDIVQF